MNASPDDLARVRIPDSDEYADQTLLWLDLPDGLETPIARHASRMSEDLRRTTFGQVVDTAHDLASGTRSQLEVVRRVQAYLTDPARFSYTRTDVSPAGDAEPLLTFLTTTHRGYCQHFAGSAALLLRMAGIPTRVAVGFATGKQVGDGRFRVEDSDAHAWIEVYFKGYGWVPFNPTPAAADARIGDGVDQFAQADGAGPPAPESRTVGLALLAVIAVIGAVLLARGLRRRRADGGVALADLLVRLAPGPARPATTLGTVAPALERIGPATAALRVLAERERFDPHGAGVRRPRRVLWRALRRDVGVVRAARLLLFGAPARPGSRRPGRPPRRRRSETTRQHTAAYDRAMSTDVVHVRALAAEDRAAWQPLWEGYLDFYASPQVADGAETLFARLVDRRDGLAGFVAEQDGRLVGLAHGVLHASTWHAGRRVTSRISSWRRRCAAAVLGER